MNDFWGRGMIPRTVNTRSQQTRVYGRAVVANLINGQDFPCLIGTGSEVTVMEYDCYTLRFRTQHQLDPLWLSLKVAKNLHILVEGVTWVRIQTDDQVVA